MPRAVGQFMQGDAVKRFGRGETLPLRQADRVGGRMVVGLRAAQVDGCRARGQDPLGVLDGGERRTRCNGGSELKSILVYSIPEPSHEDQAARFC